MVFLVIFELLPFASLIRSYGPEVSAIYNNVTSSSSPSYTDLFPLPFSTSDVCQFIMGLKEFEEHAEKVKTLTESPSNEDLLILYGLFKQAKFGPVDTSRPGMFKFNPKERAKWDAWKAVEGKSTEEAMNDYITKVKQHMEAAVST